MRLKIGNKFALVTVILLVVYGVVIFVFNQNTISTMMMEEKKSQTKELVRVSLRVLEQYRALQLKGLLTEDEAQSQAKEVIRSFLFGDGDTDYFWINDAQPTMVMHPFKPQLEGKDLSGVKDPDGVYLFNEMVKVCEAKGSGYVQYQWQYYGEKGRIEPKISYVEAFKPWNWIVGTGVYVNDINEKLASMRNALILLSAFLILVFGGVVFFFSKSITKPIRIAVEKLKDMAAGDLTQRFDVESSDEVGEISEALNAFSVMLNRSMIEVTNNAETVAASATELSATSTQIASNATLCAGKTETIVQVTGGATGNIQNILEAAGTMAESTNKVSLSVDELSVSFNEVARNCQKECEIATEASQFARSGKEEVDRLGQSSISIGKIVEVINKIADQTNLLALNATIEAASAGEAGKGFAVVADEVKQLAKQTRQATQEIEKQVDDMQENSDTAKKAIDRVAEVIEEVNTISLTIVDSVQEQTGAIATISTNISEVSSRVEVVTEMVGHSTSGLSDISANVDEFSIAVTETSAGIEQINMSSAELAGLSESLNGLVEKFKIAE